MLIDSHAHYDDERFDIDRDEVMKKIISHGVAAVVNPSTNLASMRKVLEMSESYDFYMLRSAYIRMKPWNFQIHL